MLEGSDSKALPMMPLGVRGDEPMTWIGPHVPFWLGGLMGIREAVLRRLLTKDEAIAIYADPESYEFDERALAWQRQYDEKVSNEEQAIAQITEIQ